MAIEQAKGIISEQAHCNLEEAFDTIRTYARSHNVGLTKVALSLVAGELDHAAVAGRR